MSTMTIRPMPGATPRNELPWKPYVYRGTGVDILTADLDDVPEAALAAPCPCGGTQRGYRGHLAAGEDACTESRFAVNAYHRELSRLRRLAGTEQVCPACTYTVASSTHLRLCRPS
jgi:hypothetical protein